MSAKEKAPKKDRGDSAWAELGRRFKQNPFIFVGTVIVLVITVVAFVLVPAFSSVDGGSASLNFGSYDGIKIDYTQGNYFARQRDYYYKQYQDQSDGSDLQFAALQIWRQAFEATVLRTAALRELERIGFSTPASVVDRQLAEYPSFQENGRFSAAKYRSLSEAERMDLRSSLAEDYAMSMYMSNVLDLRIPTKELEFIKSIGAKERNFELAIFPVSGFPDKDVTAYVKANPDFFRQIRLSKITFTSSEADAKKILEKVQTGTLSFEDAVKTYSKDDLADKSGDLGLKYAFELKTEIPNTDQLATVLALGQGAFSAVVKVPTGWAFFRCDEAIRQSDPSEAAVVEKARAYIFSFNRGVMDDYLIARADEFIARAKKENFGAAAQAFGIDKKAVGPIPLNYDDIEIFKSITIEDLPKASTNEAFLKAAFLTKVGEIASPIVIDDKIVVVQVVSEQDAEESMASMIDYYYPYLVSQYSQSQLQSQILASKKLKDKFYDTYLATFVSE